ncbi:MAG: hypothetical protein KA248_00620 [Kiritimatiellae bacterium]|nr:hypothetical protein [Kiritimatiellia bacterium]
MIDRKNSRQWYINFPAPIAQAMQFAKGEVCEWIIDNRQVLILRRRNAPAIPIDSKKKSSH